VEVFAFPTPSDLTELASCVPGGLSEHADLDAAAGRIRFALSAWLAMDQIAAEAATPAHLADWSADVKQRAEALLALLDRASPEHLRSGLPKRDEDWPALAQHLSDAGVPEGEQSGDMWVSRLAPLLRATVSVVTRARAEHAKRKAPRLDDAKRTLFIEIGEVFEALHGRPFSVTTSTSGDDPPSGAAVDWCQSLLTGASKAAVGTPNEKRLRKLASWGAGPHALAKRIREARGVLNVQGRAIRASRGRSAAS
jgi:hypothetical protein